VGSTGFIEWFNVQIRVIVRWKFNGSVNWVKLLCRFEGLGQPGQTLWTNINDGSSESNVVMNCVTGVS
jgi:hypothetical protein